MSHKIAYINHAIWNPNWNPGGFINSLSTEYLSHLEHQDIPVGK